MSYLTETPEGTILNVKAQPRSSKAGVDGLIGDAVKVRVKCAPVDGKANKMLQKLLAQWLGVSASAVSLASGMTGREKVFAVSGVSADEAKSRLEKW